MTARAPTRGRTGGAPRALVTGAGGFIGRTSLAPLRAAGFEVHAVLSPRAPRAGMPAPGGMATHRIDLLDDRGAIDALIETVRPTHLLHFAWIATPGEYLHSPENLRWLEASRYLLERFHAAGGRRAVMAGSCAEYDWSRVTVCHERSSPLAVAPRSLYADCKLALAHRLAERSGDGFTSAWGRIFFQFGPHEHPARLVAGVVRALLSGEEARVTHGRQVRSFLPVSQVGAAFAALLASPVEGPVNIGAAEPLSIAELLDRIAALIGRRDLLKLGALAPRADEPPRLLPDLTRLREEVGFEPGVPLDQGLRETIDWWRTQLARGVEEG